MPRRKTPAAVSAAAIDSIQERLTHAAHSFAQDILRVLSASTLAELTMLTGRSLEATEGSALKRGPGRPPKVEKNGASARPAPAPRVAAPPQAKAGKGKKPSAQTSAVRRLAGTKPVECPVAGCKNPGIRSKMNFCREHAESIPKAERVRLRQAQREAHLLPRAPEPEKKKGKKK